MCFSAVRYECEGLGPNTSPKTMSDGVYRGNSRTAAVTIKHHRRGKDVKMNSSRISLGGGLDPRPFYETQFRKYRRCFNSSRSRARINTIDFYDGAPSRPHRVTSPTFQRVSAKLADAVVTQSNAARYSRATRRDRDRYLNIDRI